MPVFVLMSELLLCCLQGLYNLTMEVIASGILHSVVRYKFFEVTEEHTASIISIKE
jgi:hypothetical protein